MPRGRPKGSKNKSTTTSPDSFESFEKELDLEDMSKSVGKVGHEDNSKGPSLFKRDENGLLVNTKYVFDDDGSVNWRAMIKDEHLFPNKGWFESRKKEAPRTIDGLKDHQLLIKLSGIKELARLRGFNHVSYHNEKCELNHVAVTCTIGFIPNYETGGACVSYEDMANATLENTSSFATKFLETIACNRAFVRCVRNFLNVHIVGDDEIDKSNLPNGLSTSSALSPQGVLESHAEAAGCPNFEDFKSLLRKWYKDGLYQFEDGENSPANWESYSDISPKEARVFIKLIKTQP